MTADALARLCRRLLAEAEAEDACGADGGMGEAALMVYVGDPYPLAFADTPIERGPSGPPDPLWPFIR